MTGFELQTSQIGSARSTNWAKTTTQVIYKLLGKAKRHWPVL